MLADVRVLRHERRDLRAEVARLEERLLHPGLRLALVEKYPWLGRFLHAPPPT